MEKQYLEICNKIIPESYLMLVKNYDAIFNFELFRYRDKFIEKMGFVLISNDWIIPLAKWIGNRRCIEIMSGTGALTYALKQQNVDIFATDNFTWDGMNNWNTDQNYWTVIEDIDCIKAIEKYVKNIDIIIMSWPYMDDTAYRALLKMREVNPNCVMIAIVEGKSGCTADDNFFDNLELINDSGFYEVIKNFKQWFGLHDYPILIK